MRRSGTGATGAPEPDLAAAVALRLAGYAEAEAVRLRELRNIGEVEAGILPTTCSSICTSSPPNPIGAQGWSSNNGSSRGCGNERALRCGRGGPATLRGRGLGLLLHRRPGRAAMGRVAVDQGRRPHPSHRFRQRGPLRHPSPDEVREQGAEDLLVHKVFAGRDRDWADVRGVVARQGGDLDLDLAINELQPLLAAKGTTADLDRFLDLVKEGRSS